MFNSFRRIGKTNSLMHKYNSVMALIIQHINYKLYFLMRCLTVFKMQFKQQVVVSILMQIARFLGVCPWVNPSCLKSLYQILTLTITFGVSAISIYYNCNDRYKYMNTMNTFIDLLSSMFLTIQGGIIQIMSLMHSKSWSKLLCELNFEGFYWQLLIIHLVFIAKTLWNFFVWAELMEWQVNLYYFFRTLNEYNAVITIALIARINIALKDQFLYLHTILNKNFHQQIEIRHYSQVYMKLMKLLDHFNCTFGYQILLIMGNAVVAILESLYKALTYHQHQKILILSWGVSSSTFVLVF